MSAWLSAVTMHHDQRWLGGTIANMTRQRHRSTPKSPRQRRCQQELAMPSPTWLSIYIASWPSRLSSTVGSRTQHHRHQHHSGGLMFASPTSNPAQGFTVDQALRHEEYHSDQRPDSGTHLPTSLTSTRGERAISSILWDTSPNQLSHFLRCILFWVNTSIYFQLVNILL
jgi:hypothetical protein